MAAQTVTLIVGGKRINRITRIANPYLKARVDPRNADKTDEELLEKAEFQYFQQRLKENIKRGSKTLPGLGRTR